ncbi:MAG: hypothetical protein ACRCSP_01770 [Rhodoglobus sp.]
MNTMPRMRRTVAFDPRLLIGLLMVIGSVVGVVGIVSAADKTVQVYVASTPLAPGDRIKQSDLPTRSLRLGDTQSLYLLPGDIPREGFVITRSVLEGELIPASAVGSTRGLGLSSIVFEVDGELAESIGPGSTVDIWSAPETDGGQSETPSVIASDVTVVRLVEATTLVAGAQTTTVELLVPQGQVPEVLTAVSHSDVISIVPTTVPGVN